jgi:hypothetical protein
VRTNWAQKRAGSGRPGGTLTRRTFLGALSSGAVEIAPPGMLGCEPTSRTMASTAPGGPGQARAFRTRPDLRPPAIKLDVRFPAAAPGYIFATPKKETGGRSPGPGRQAARAGFRLAEPQAGAGVEIVDLSSMHRERSRG